MFETINNENNIRVLYNGNELASYQHQNYFWHPHIHPLKTLDGKTLTMDWPGDHPWHNGMFFAWKYLDGFNVWDRSDPKTAGLAPKSLGPVNTDCGEESCRLTHKIEQLGPGGEHLLFEERELRFTKAKDYPRDVYVLDWDIKFKTNKESIEISAEDKFGGYGGMMTRFVRTVSPEITNRRGGAITSEFSSSPTEWVKYRFQIDGQMSTKSHEHWVGMAMLDHPQNEHKNSLWHVYFESHVQGINQTHLQKNPFTLKQGQEKRLRYRHIIFTAKLDDDTVEKIYQDFISER